MLAHKALIVNHFMSGAPSHEVKDEPQSGAGCEADAFMNVRVELLQFFYKNGKTVNDRKECHLQSFFSV